jgi:rfaE bifunctional protein nucleotidyltransferase chain/domain
VELGQNAGGKGILVRTGYGRKAEISMRAAKKYCAVASDVYEAVRLVLADLIKAECPNDPAMASKFKTLGQLHDIVATAKRAKRRVVLANGCFDLLHGGHVSFLEASRAAGDLLVLAVNSNASIRRLKGAQRPLLRESERLQLLAGLECVDYLTVFYTDAADEVLEEIHPDIHAKGTDYTSDRVPERQTAIRLGIETYIAGAPKENSTRDIIEVVVERAKAGAL